MLFLPEGWHLKTRYWRATYLHLRPEMTLEAKVGGTSPLVRVPSDITEDSIPYTLWLLCESEINSLLQITTPLAIHSFCIMNVLHTKKLFSASCSLSEHYLMELFQKIPARVSFILFHCCQLFLNEEKTKFIQPSPLMNIHFIFSVFPLQIKPHKNIVCMHPTTRLWCHRMESQKTCRWVNGEYTFIDLTLY